MRPMLRGRREGVTRPPRTVASDCRCPDDSCRKPPRFTGSRGVGEVREPRIFGFETHDVERRLRSYRSTPHGSEQQKNSRTSPTPRLPVKIQGSPRLHRTRMAPDALSAASGRVGLETTRQLLRFELRCGSPDVMNPMSELRSAARNVDAAARRLVRVGVRDIFGSGRPDDVHHWPVGFFIEV